MERITITSADNSGVKQAVSLRKSAAARRETGLFVIDGRRICADAARSGIKIKIAYFTEQRGSDDDYTRDIEAGAERVYNVSPEIMRKLADTKTPQGALCVCEIPQNPLSIGRLSVEGRYVALENIGDPANLGGVARTAEALGIDGLILSRGCCDIYNQKSLRASMGAWFRLPFTVCDDFPRCVAELTGRGFRVYGSVPSPAAVDIRKLDFSQGCVCVIGNEGNGLTDETKSVCSELITVPMGGRAESLNAAAAAALIMWEMVR